MLPNFICPGAARAATTTLYYLLIQHPQIYLPKIKETRFFAIDYDKGLSWYESRYYSTASREIAIGDISPVYLVHEKCPERIFKSLGPAVKFIFMLRNPIERAISHYSLLKRMQIEDLPLAAALKSDSRPEKSLQHFRHEYALQYLKESSYSQHIKRYLQYFRRDNIKFIIFEEFTRNIEDHLVDITSFLGVQSRFQFNLDLYQNQNFSSRHATLSRLFYRNPFAQKIRTLIQMNTNWKTQVILKKFKNTILSTHSTQSGPVVVIDHELESQLRDRFHGEIVQLEDLLQRDLSIWQG